MKKNGIWAVALALVLSVPAASGAATVAKVLSFSGTLRTSSGAPESTYQNVTFRLYDVSDGGAALFDETLGVQPGTDGTFSVKIGGTKPLDAALFAQQLYLGIQVQGEAEMVPRTQLTPTPYSWSVDWSSLKGFPAACPAGQFASGVGLALTCSAPPQAVAAVVGSGVINATTASGTVTVSLAAAGCAIGEVLKFGALGWGCEADADTIGLATVTRDASLVGNGTGGSPLGLMSCTDGQILKRNGSAWGCAQDVDTDTGLTAVSHDASLVGDGAGAATPLGVAFLPANASGSDGAATTAARSDHRHNVTDTLGAPFVEGSVSFNTIVIAGVPVGGTHLMPGSSATWTTQLNFLPTLVPTAISVSVTSAIVDNGSGVGPPPFIIEGFVIRPGDPMPCPLPAPSVIYNPVSPPFLIGQSVVVKPTFTNFGGCSLTDDATVVVRLTNPASAMVPAAIINGFIKVAF